MPRGLSAIALHAGYGFMDLWLFFPDADKASRASMRNLETHVATEGITLLCCAAQPEVETYACAGVPATTCRKRGRTYAGIHG